MSDPLSDVLSLLRVESTRSTRLEARGPWALSFPAHHHIVFGAVLEGGMILTLGDGAGAVTLAAGDCYLLTRGRPYRMGNGARVRAESGRAVFEQRVGDDGVVRYGEGPLGLVWAGGSFRLEAESGDFLLNFLPPIIHLPSGSIDGSPLRAAYGLIRAETANRKPGASAIAGSIANIFMVQMLRAFLERSGRPSGWLGAVSDQRIGRALIAIHRDYARPWTVEQLAALSGMSRTAFAVRFRTLVGVAPLEYLSGWRMAVAKAAILKGEPLAEVAEKVGYSSDAAFNAAFKRATGQSPGKFRSA
jgi:AraC-like DNA-binding protein